MKLLARLCTGFGALMLGFFIQVSFAVAQSNHSLGSGQDVYRIEVKNINAYEVLEAGDTDGVGELYELRVRLEGGELGRQYHQYTDRAGASRRLINRSTQDQGNNTYVNIRVGNLVTHGGHEKNRNLWIHSKRANAYNSTNPIRLNLSATELDCAGQRVCRRKSVGTVTVEFTIPDFKTPPSNRCGPDNTFKLTRVDDDLAILGVDNVDVYNYTKGDSERVLQVLTQHKKGGPRLRPINADICIASTVKPEDRVVTTPKMDFLKNQASGRCLSLPNYQLQGQDMRAVVKNCSFQNTAGNPERTKWVFTPIDYQTFTVRSSMMDRCLTLKAAVDNREGGPVKLFECSSHNDQRWQMFRGGFKNVSSGKCLNVHGREHKENGQVSVYTCAETPDQQWSKIDEPTANDLAPLHRRSR